jgi:hypothetical protein
MDFQFTTNALQYSLNELARRIGLSAEADVQGQLYIDKTPVYYSSLDNNSFPARSIVVVPCAPDYFGNMISSTSKCIKWLSPEDVFPQGIKPVINEKIPVLAWGQGFEDSKRPFAEVRADGTIVFFVDIFASTLFMLTRWEEKTNLVRDEHGRFPGWASLAYRQGFLDRPIVDEYALIFGEWLKLVLQNWHPKKGQFSIMLSHDIDHIYSFSSYFDLLKRIGGDIIHRHSLKLASGSLILGIRERINPIQESKEYNAVSFLAEQSNKRGIQSTFFFLASGHHRYDSGYQINSVLMRQCIRQLQNNGFRVGLHPSYISFGNGQRLKRERTLFQKVLGLREFGCRQHYLRFEIPTTWEVLDKQGFLFDSSMTYSNYAGFRCGTCYPFHPFDINEDRWLSIIEEPLIVMESAVFNNITDLHEAEEKVMQMATRCSNVGGTFSLLWHNRTIVNHPEWTPVYLRILDRIILL